jgi:hypothetical protein
VFFTNDYDLVIQIELQRKMFNFDHQISEFQTKKKKRCLCGAQMPPRVANSIDSHAYVKGHNFKWLVPLQR